MEGLARADVLGRGVAGKTETNMAEAQNAYEMSHSNTEVGLVSFKPHEKLSECFILRDMTYFLQRSFPVENIRRMARELGPESRLLTPYLFPSILLSLLSLFP